MTSERIYGGSGLIYDETVGDFVYAENAFWDEEYQGWRACAAVYQPLKSMICVNEQLVEAYHVVSR